MIQNGASLRDKQHILIKQPNVYFPHKPIRPERDVFMNLLVPAAVHLIQNNIMIGVQFYRNLSNNEIRNEEGTKTYTASTLNWICECVPDIEFLLPCAALLHVVLVAVTDSSKFPFFKLY